MLPGEIAIVVFAALSFLVLIAALSAIWLIRIPKRHEDKLDLEALARDRLKATVAISAMVTMLGVVSLISHGVMRSSDDGQSHRNAHDSSGPNQSSVTTGSFVSTLVCPKSTEKPVEVSDVKELGMAEHAESVPISSDNK